MKRTYLLSAILIVAGIFIITLMDTDNSLTGLFNFADNAPEGFEFQPPEIVSKEAAADSISAAETEIAVMMQHNFTTIFLNDILAEAKTNFAKDNYTEVLKDTELIFFISKKKIEFVDKVELIRVKVRSYENQKINISEGNALLSRSLEAFDQDQLVDAQKLLQEADSSLERSKAEMERQKNLVYLGKIFLLRYWWQIILVLLLSGIISFFSSKQIIKKRRKNRIFRLKEEQVSILEEIKSLQKRCFVDKKISTNEYKRKAAKYEERIAEIKRTIPVIEAQLQENKGKRLEKPKANKIGLEVKR